MTEEVKQTGLPVRGYQAQSPEAIQQVNDNKLLEERVLRVIDRLKISTAAVDQRWTAIAKTHIELGFMAMNRAIFQPQRVALPEDNGVQQSPPK